ncbi:MAG: GNAT family N-acetyltransferase [Gemmatimonadetes bacterium]|jgi:ribosomal protein S18 acetylase RimI-like enzyme|nr:GNAT family N-acetyltransferase [Planctomycetota bacterium]MCZ6759109.1 GNAT family N-acetyltransferase [Gemmatimonadota bacterium]
MHRFEIESTNIRDMEPADSDSVAGFMAELNLFEARISADRDTSEQAGRDHFEYLRGEIRSLGGFCLVAEFEGRLLGCLLAAPESMPGFFVKPECRDYGEIHDIYVVPEAREKGLARKLINEAEDRFRKMGFKQVGLYSLAGNKHSIGTYERLGFEHYEVFMRKNIAR